MPAFVVNGYVVIERRIHSARAKAVWYGDGQQHPVIRGNGDFNVIRSESSAETIVNMEITAEMPPAHATGTFRSWLMVGHADPSSESGNPRLINAT